MSSTSPNDAYERQRQEMVRLHLAGGGIHDVLVLNAMRLVPRHEFVPESARQASYEDRSLPIGEGQTISQPYMVALMLEHLALRRTDRVLEVGTGLGYVTALLSTLCGEIYSVERIPELAAAAQQTLQRLHYLNVKIKTGDGRMGWSEHAPFEAILVSAATPEIPPDLFAQLREGGRMVLPIGPPSEQTLQLVRKIGGRLEVKVFDHCRFVPLIEGPAG